MLYCPFRHYHHGTLGLPSFVLQQEFAVGCQCRGLCSSDVTRGARRIWAKGMCVNAVCVRICCTLFVLLLHLFLLLSLTRATHDPLSFFVTKSHAVDSSRLYGFLDNAADMKMPDIKLPDISVPDMPDMPSLGDASAVMDKLMGASSGGGNDNTIMLGGAAAAVVLLGVMASAASSSGGGEAPSAAGKPNAKRKTKQQQLLEIDYHAAARLAYQNWLRDHPDEKSKPDAYEAFEALYEANAVALATSKKAARDLQAFDNTPAKPIPPRQITPKKKHAPPLFFANE